MVLSCCRGRLETAVVWAPSVPPGTEVLVWERLRGQKVRVDKWVRLVCAVIVSLRPHEHGRRLAQCFPHWEAGFLRLEVTSEPRAPSD